MSENAIVASQTKANLLAAMPFGVANSIYRAHGEYDRGVMMGTGNLGGQIVIPLSLLALGQPSTIIAAGLVVQFITHLFGFAGKKARQAAAPRPGKELEPLTEPVLAVRRSDA